MTSNDKLEAITAQRLRGAPARPGREHGGVGTCDPDTELCVEERIRHLVAEYLRVRKG
jgi:hypothetical protein